MPRIELNEPIEQDGVETESIQADHVDFSNDGWTVCTVSAKVGDYDDRTEIIPNERIARIITSSVSNVEF